MSPEINLPLTFGAILSAVAAAAHICVIIGGAPLYRFFGAGEQFAVASEKGKIYPAVVTFGIAGVLAAWAAYALAVFKGDVVRDNRCLPVARRGWVCDVGCEVALQQQFYRRQFAYLLWVWLSAFARFNAGLG